MEAAPRRIGYARVSTSHQNIQLQVDALRAAGCEPIYTDRGVSGTTRRRIGLDAALEDLGAADTFVVWKLDRVGRSMKFLIELVDGLGARDIGFHSLTDGIDTSTHGGRMVFHIMASLAEFERSLIHERCVAGMQAARRAGKRVGRPSRLSIDQVNHAQEAIAQGGETITSMSRILGVHRNTLTKALRG